MTTQDKGKRISFDEGTAGHIYEMILEHLCLLPPCGTCEHIDKRFRKFLGEKEVRAIVKTIKKNGYCNKLTGIDNGEWVQND